MTAAWDRAGQTLRFDFRAAHAGRRLHRASRVRVLPGSPPAVCSGRRLAFSLELPARGSSRVRLAIESLVDGRWRSPLDLGSDVLTPTDRDRALDAWRDRGAHLETPTSLVAGAFNTAAQDLASLRLWELGDLARASMPAPDRDERQRLGADPAWIVSAGMPLYSGVYGRDVLTAGWQSALLGSEASRGAVEAMARTQATRDSPFRDEEPGRMIHEMRRGPLCDLGLIPQRAYYGSQTTPAMFVLALSELWHWTGDDSLLHRYRDAALQTFDWADRYGDRDGDGFLEYERRSPFGPKNQGWKDSDDAIRYSDGRQVPNPIATVEEQAFHFVALQRMAEILVALGEDDRADDFLERSRDLRRRWHDAFWMPDEGFYAMALDPDKRQVRSIGSNVGHALGVGIVPTEYARRVADRLMAPDLFSGWGIRTLSREHPSYNPFGYHLGTVWPVENATFALGLKRYGFDDDVERLVTAQLMAVSHFAGHRLPEVISGHGSDERQAPSVYPGSNAPQAWSASAVIQLIQVLLGLYPFAPLGVLVLVRPRLPAWLPAVTLRNVQVGTGRISIRFERSNDGSVHHDVIERSGRLLVLAAPPPNSTEPDGWAESVKRWAIEHAPGRQMRALRIAIGAE